MSYYAASPFTDSAIELPSMIEGVMSNVLQSEKGAEDTEQTTEQPAKKQVATGRKRNRIRLYGAKDCSYDKVLMTTPTTLAKTRYTPAPTKLSELSQTIFTSANTSHANRTGARSACARNGATASV